MRAYRPGSRGGEVFDEEIQREKEEKMVVYAQRARVGLPLFDPPVGVSTTSAENLLDRIFPLTATTTW